MIPKQPFNIKAVTEHADKFDDMCRVFGVDFKAADIIAMHEASQLARLFDAYAAIHTSERAAHCILARGGSRPELTYAGVNFFN